MRDSVTSNVPTLFLGLPYRNEILDDVHVWKWMNLQCFARFIDFARRSNAGVKVRIGPEKAHEPDASKCVSSVDVHRTASADAFSARTTKSQRRIEFILDFDKSIKNHRTATAMESMRLILCQQNTYSLKSIT